MGTHLSRADRPTSDPTGMSAAVLAHSSPRHDHKRHDHKHDRLKEKTKGVRRHHSVQQINGLEFVKEDDQQEKPKGLTRHHTVHQINSAESNHGKLFRNASYGDFRQHVHDDLKSVSKRFSQVLGRTESLSKEEKHLSKEERHAVIYKHDFQTKYFCNLTSPLSHGRYATVTAAESFLTAQNVAVKIIRKDKLFDKKSGKRCAGENVRVEVLALRNLANQPNVVKFLDVFEDEAFFYVVMELCKGGNLLERINKGGSMSEEQAGPLLKQMLTVTRICHSHGIAHRDLKLENFVFLSDKEDYPLNLVDFGSAAFFKSGERRPFKGAVGTFNYMAPEVYDSCYGPSADVWSLGIIAYAMLCSFLPFTASSNEELREKIKNEEIVFSHSTWEQVSETAKDLLQKMLEKNPDVRISTADALGLNNMIKTVDKEKETHKLTRGSDNGTFEEMVDSNDYERSWDVICGCNNLDPAILESGLNADGELFFWLLRGPPEMPESFNCDIVAEKGINI